MEERGDSVGGVTVNGGGGKQRNLIAAMAELTKCA